MFKEIKELNKLLKNNCIPTKILKDRLEYDKKLYKKCRENEMKHHNGNYTDVSLKLEGAIQVLEELLGEEK